MFDERPWETPYELSQQELVRLVMYDGKKHTVQEVAALVKGEQCATSTRIRNLRKKKFGKHTVSTERDPVDHHFYYWIDFSEPNNKRYIQTRFECK